MSKQKRLRDEFAMAAMQGFAANLNTGAKLSVIAERAYKWADAILAKRNKSVPEENNDWIEWIGGECPVSEETIVDIKYRDGDIDLICHPLDCGWSHEYGAADIVAYRIVK